LAYGTRPAHLFGQLGLALGGLGMLILAYLFYVKFFEDTAIAGRPLLLVGFVLFLFGMMLVSVGLLAEILVRIYHESQGKPIYGGRVTRVGPTGRGRRGKYAMVAPALAALGRERRGFQVLVVRGTRVLGLPGVAAARTLGKAVVLQPELNGEMSGEVYTWGTRLHVPAVRRAVGAGTAARNLLLRDADAFVAMSRAIAPECLAAGAPPERIVRLPHGVDTDRFSPASPGEQRALRARYGLPESRVIATYTGRLVRGKGLEALGDAFASLAAEQPAV